MNWGSVEEGERGILDRRVGLFLRNLASPSDLSCISFEIVIVIPFQVVGLFLKADLCILL